MVVEEGRRVDDAREMKSGWTRQMASEGQRSRRQPITITTYIRIIITITATTKDWTTDHPRSTCSDSLPIQYRTQASLLTHLITTITTTPRTHIQDTITTIPQHAHLPYPKNQSPPS